MVNGCSASIHEISDRFLIGAMTTSDKDGFYRLPIKWHMDGKFTESGNGHHFDLLPPKYAFWLNVYTTDSGPMVQAFKNKETADLKKIVGVDRVACLEVIANHGQGLELSITTQEI